MTNEKLLTIQEASEWATEFLGRQVSISNISYLIQYGRIKKFGDNGFTQVMLQDLVNYYKSNIGKREVEWKRELGQDLNWGLSFDNIPEKERTKHVHRLHPYKGKFIPQLVEYFLDSHTDEFKKSVYFHPNDVILDPFCGSGTTLVQANELGIHALGVDVSAFNAMISNVKIGHHNLPALKDEINKITKALREYVLGEKHIEFEAKLAEELTEFNNTYFPSPTYRYQVQNGEINQDQYGKEKEQEFQKVFNKLVSVYNITVEQNRGNTFLDKWYNLPIREEINYVFNLIHNISDINIKKILAVILSRTMRSCRATTHADLATLVDPVFSTYYCRKHGKICKPLFSILGWWERYSSDTMNRLYEFNSLRTDTYQYCFTGDARRFNVISELTLKKAPFVEELKKKKIKGIFTSPPYVGLIDYHEQHAYAYDLFGFARRDNQEIGSLYKGQGKDAKESYIIGISEVLINCAKFLVNDYDIFLVANDKFGLYPKIINIAGMKIVNEFKRPVLHRTEKNKTPYSETIFHVKAR